MQFYELSLTGKIDKVRLNGRSSQEKFLDWILEDEAFELSPFQGGYDEAQRRLKNLNWQAYGKTRNHMDGAVSHLSPYIEHGLIEPQAILNFIDTSDERIHAYHFLQQLSWREFYQKKYQENPKLIWQDMGPYKTGYRVNEYSDKMPQDILMGKTPVALINQFIHTLKTTGYLHNHARLYLASYIVHWRRVKWQAGAKWMLGYLIDGNLASNNFSWQWVASTGSSKPYIFNLENVKQFAGEGLNLSGADNYPLVGSYDDLKKRLFPYLNERIAI